MEEKVRRKGQSWQDQHSARRQEIEALEEQIGVIGSDGVSRPPSYWKQFRTNAVCQTTAYSAPGVFDQ